jgi:6-phosphofructokinase 1
MVVEVMGRHVGWIAIHSGIAGGADAIVIPERPWRVLELADVVESRRRRGKRFAIIVVSEGVRLDEDQEEGGLDEFGHPQLADVGVGERLAKSLRELVDADIRVVVLGHVQRGGTPTAYDRILATRFGARAAELVAEGRFGRMVALRGDHIADVPLAEAVAALKEVPPERYEVAEPFFG